MDINRYCEFSCGKGFVMFLFAILLGNVDSQEAYRHYIMRPASHRICSNKCLKWTPKKLWDGYKKRKVWKMVCTNQDLKCCPGHEGPNCERECLNCDKINGFERQFIEIYGKMKTLEDTCTNQTDIINGSTNNGNGDDEKYTQNCTCPAGPRGLKGRAGPTGPPGAPGRQGFQGPQGPAGDPRLTGPPGPQGLVGLPGSNGPKGFGGRPGAKGERGFRGKFGRRGLKGDPGLDGLIGPTGQPGDPGIPGAASAKGDLGPPGMPGRDGRPGLPGRTGEPGQIVFKSEPGLEGRPGEKGAPGLPGSDGRPGDISKGYSYMGMAVVFESMLKPISDKVDKQTEFINELLIGLAKQNNEVDELKSENALLKHRTDKADDTIHTLETRLDELDRYSRRTSMHFLSIIKNHVLSKSADPENSELEKSQNTDADERVETKGTSVK